MLFWAICDVHVAVHVLAEILLDGSPPLDSAVLGVLAWRKKAAPKAGPEFRMHRRWISQ